MKRILGIDSSIPQGSVALLENDRIISETSLQGTSNFSGGLLRMVNQTLLKAKLRLDDVDGFGITIGPGSFTGLRVGVSLVKGFILSMEKPFQGIDTLEAVAACVEPIDHPVCTILDARKKEVYCAFFKYEGQRLIRTSPDRAMLPEDLLGLISEPTVFTGSGLTTYGDFFCGQLGSRFIEQHPLRKRTVAASAAFLARERFTKSRCLDLDELKIKYVRKSEAELNFIQKDTQLTGRVQHGN